MIKFVRPDRINDFEATIAKLREALARSTSRRRREQGNGWRAYEVVEPASNGDAVYVFDIDPAVRGAD